MNPNEFSRPATELINSRSSWRSYKPGSLEPELRTEILEYISKQKTGPLGEKCRFQLIEKDDPAVFDNATLGTYGFIKNAHNFIAGTVVKGESHWEDYGYLLERIILKMTDLGLGTCWLGGTFKRSEFGPLLETSSDEVIPAITPVGYGTARRGIRDRIIRSAAKSRTRKPWSSMFFDGTFGLPLSEPAAGKYAPVLEMVRQGPSASNRQPWRIISAGGNFHFFLERTPNYSGLSKNKDLQRVDMGIAMCHFDLTARELGLKGSWVKEPPAISFSDLIEYIVTWKAG